jgi:hypothetical protein
MVKGETMKNKKKLLQMPEREMHVTVTRTTIERMYDLREFDVTYTPLNFTMEARPAERTIKVQVKPVPGPKIRNVRVRLVKP